ncbi:MAG TPA: hypothetical protein VMW56_15645 [Candidatus Margulisiibacteriota bacterium]|nr:hypothetical protein [Candidatus Margulisiibacteriota bacterium]
MGAIRCAPAGNLSCRSAPTGAGAGLPRFVERELREFLTCGVLARGWVQQTMKQMENRKPETENGT